MDDFIDVRVIYSKISNAKYISHLDINRCMQRAFKRTKLPVWYTQGFNPHLYLTFALALPLGFESLYETMDLRVAGGTSFEELKTSLNGVLPRDIQVIDVLLQENKPEKIMSADYNVELCFSEPKATINDEFVQFLKSETIIVKKKTKKGIKDLDIKPHIKIVTMSWNENVVNLKVNMAAGIFLNISPLLLINNFCEVSGEKLLRYSIVKTAMKMEDGTFFR